MMMMMMIMITTMAMIMNEKLIANPAEAVVCTNHCARYSAVFFHLTPTTL